MPVGPTEFAALIRTLVHEPGTHSVIEVLRSPPGRSPAPELSAASDWYRQLGPAGRGQVDWIVREASRVALFGALALLDGTRAHSTDAESHFELAEVTSRHRTVISPDQGPLLHDLFNLEVPPASRH
jgi:hypothetical protein